MVRRSSQVRTQGPVSAVVADRVVELLDAYLQDEKRLLDILLDRDTGGSLIRVTDLGRQTLVRRISLGQAVNAMSRVLARRGMGIPGASKKA